MAHDAFVSYCQGDKPVADAIVARLEQGGIRCWMAPRDIVPGTSWGEAIVEAINGSKVLVLVLSGDSNRSPQVVREVERAVANGLVVIPFRIEDVDPTGAMAYFVGSQHWLDALTPPLERHIERLAQTAASLLSRELPAPPPGPPPAPGARHRRKRWLPMAVAGGIALAVAVGAVVLTLVLTRDGSTPTTAVSAVVTATTIDAGVPTTPATAAATTTTAATTTAAEELPTSVTTGPTLPQDETVLPEGFVLEDYGESGFTVGLPAEWFSFALMEGDVEAIFAEMEQYVSAEQAAAFREGLEAGVAMPLLAFGPTGDPNMNVTVVELGPFDTIEMLESVGPEMAAQMGAELITTERLDIGGHEALLLVLSVDYPEGTALQHFYWVFAGRTGFIATFTTFEGAGTEVFREIMGTFTIVG